MTDILQVKDTKGRLIGDNQKPKVENKFHIGEYDFQQSNLRADGDTFLYYKYMNTDYGEFKEDDFYQNMFDHVVAPIKDPWLPTNESSVDKMLCKYVEQIRKNDTAFNEHLVNCNEVAASTRDNIDDDDHEEAAMLWAKYLLERDP